MLAPRVDNCPNCAASLIGDPVPEEHRTHKADCEEQKVRFEGRCYCLPWGEITHFRREIGIEIPGVYDGTLYWLCRDCGWAWQRWSETGLSRIARRHIDKNNEELGV